MNFATAFLRTFLWRPHRALDALYWYVTGRKVRARNRLRMAAAGSPNAYPMWIGSVEKLKTVIEQAPAIIAQWERRPLFSVIALAQDQATVDALAAMLRRQPYSNWELLTSVQAVDNGGDRIRHLPDPGDPNRSLTNGIDAAQGDYIVPLGATDRLSPLALFRFGEALQGGEQPTLIYGDEDRIGLAGRRLRPWFKPDWNAEMFLAQDHVGAGCAIARDAAKQALPIDDDLAPIAIDALLVSVSAAPGSTITHLPHVLVHRTADAPPDTQAMRIAAIGRLLASEGATVDAGPFGTVRVAWPLPADLPIVSIIVPTRDKVGLLRACIDGLLARTSYPNYEVLIVDNGSVEPATHAYFQAIVGDPRVRVLPYDAPYNYSAINNFAVEQARGSYLCLLNNDTEILDGDWLEQMMRQATRPHVGAVGAKLLYDDGSIQHAGVVVGLGQAAGHAHRFVRNDRPGYFNQPHIQQYVSAVTAACLVVERAKFEAVGGLDAESLAIAFNDVDLCLKLQAHGWRNVYAPQAVLIHHESRSRGSDVSPRHIERYRRELAVLQERWGTKTYVDPHYSPRLNPANEAFLIDLPE